MVKLNVPKSQKAPETHEGAPAKRITPEQELRRSVMACMLWEDQFYESGEYIADRIAGLIPVVEPQSCFEIASVARHQMKLRHVPLLLATEMLKHPTHSSFVCALLESICMRPDEITECLAIYWRDGKKKPIPAQMKRGLARAFNKFDAYQLAKYKQEDKEIRLRDAMFLVHPKPKDDDQAILFDKLADNKLDTPDTWEVAISAAQGADEKREAWTRLIMERRLGGMAVLRNIRNMRQAGVDENLIRQIIETGNYRWVLPFRFIAAAKYNPEVESSIEIAMLMRLEDEPFLSGKTVILVDSSGSMNQKISKKSVLLRWDAATGLAILLRELCTRIRIFDFAGDVMTVPDRRGFALRSAIRSPHNGTDIRAAVDVANVFEADRIICITDEQSRTEVPDPYKVGYMINVASYQNGVGYGKWTHIDGWSESIINYIREREKQQVQ